jgi:hypothetical protein
MFAKTFEYKINSSYIFSVCSMQFFFFFFFGRTQDLTLARQALQHLSHSASPFLCWAFLR